MPKIDKQYQHDISYRFETLDEYRNRRKDQVWLTLTGHTREDALAIMANSPKGYAYIPGAMGAMLTTSGKKWNKRVNRAYGSEKQRVKDESTAEVPISASLGIVGSDSPVQTNVSWETPVGGIDYSGQKRKKAQGISYNLGLF